MEHKGGCHCGNLRLSLRLSQAPEETRLRACGFTLLDAQVPTPHLSNLGAVAIPRAEYLARLRAALLVDARLDG